MTLRQIRSLAIKITNEAARHAAGKVAGKLEKQAKIYIDDFYAEYTPTTYIRTHNLYRACRAYQQNKYRIYTGGVLLSAETMYDNYNDSPENVLRYTLISGYHGHYISPFPSVYEKLKKYRDNELPINLYIKNGLQQAINKYGYML